MKNHQPSKYPSHPAKGLGALVATLLLLTPRFSFAQNASAEQLFHEGKSAFAAGNYRVACPKFLESQRLEPAPGTLLNLADCEEHLGQYTLAAQHFREAASLYRVGDTRIAFAKERLASAEKNLAKLTITLGPSSAPGSSVLRDGIQVPSAALTSPILLDPGDHSVQVMAPGADPRAYSVTLGKGESKTLLVETRSKVVEPVRANHPAVIQPATPPITTEPSGSALFASGTEADSVRSGPSKAIGWSLIALGGASAVLGIVGGIQAISQKSIVDEHCSTVDCDRQGFDAQGPLSTWSTISTIGVIAGVVGVGAGTVIVLTRPFDKRVSVTALPSGNGGFVRVGGTF